MQKFTRIAIVLLLIMVAIAIVASQTQLYQKGHTGFVLSKGEASVVAAKSVAQETSPSVLAPPPATTIAVSSAIMTYASPDDVKREVAEREKDREVLRSIQKETARLAASSLAQNYLLLFQAIIYFLILIIIFSLLETVKKFADAAVRSAEAARISAEAASKAGQNGSHGKRRFEGNKFLMRRLRGNFRKQ